MAPSYAKIQGTATPPPQLIQSVSLKQFSWLRFIVDIDMKRVLGREAVEAFLERANSFHPTIGFTAEVSNDKHVYFGTTYNLAMTELM